MSQKLTLVVFFSYLSLTVGCGSNAAPASPAAATVASNPAANPANPDSQQPGPGPSALPVAETLVGTSWSQVKTPQDKDDSIRKIQIFADHVIVGLDCQIGTKTLPGDQSKSLRARVENMSVAFVENVDLKTEDYGHGCDWHLTDRTIISYKFDVSGKIATVTSSSGLVFTFQRL
jgi:hypothetical protein